MRIESVRIASYAIPLDPPWPSAEGPVGRREGAVLFLAAGSGAVGIGETAPWPGFGLETLPSSLAALRLAARYLIGLPSDRFRTALADLHRLAPVAASPCARHAIDLALHDLMAQEAGVSIGRLLGGGAALERVPASRAIPRLPADECVDEAARAVRDGFRTIKLKVGGAPPVEDVERVRTVREAVAPEIRIRVDANQAWSEAEAIEALRAMRRFDVELCEQPVAAEALSAMARVRARAGVPIAADESVRDLASARRLLHERAADILVIKPMALGGLFPARAVAALAQEFGAGVVVTSLLEGPVGQMGALHLAASLGRPRFAHGVATRIADDEYEWIGMEMEGGAIRVPGLNSARAWSTRWIDRHTSEVLTVGALTEDEDT